MRIFIAYGYNPRDRWVEDVVFPLVEAFGWETLHGKVLGGQDLPESIKALIDSSDGLIGFATQRDPLSKKDAWITHPWVRDELVYALDRKKHVLEVREKGVEELSGLAGRDRQYVPYEEGNAIECVIGIVETLGLWHRRTTERFQLLPYDDVRPHAEKPCTYRIKDGGSVFEGEAAIEDIEGGLFINIPNLSRSSFVQIEIGSKKGILSSPYASMHKFAITLSWKN